MQRLWSPWRSEYVGGEEPDSDECLFCRVARERRDEENHVLVRGDEVFVMLNRFPYNSGHLMIVPYGHVADFPSLPASVASEMMLALATCLTALGDVYHPDGYNTGMNLGTAAGAGIADHLHMHVVPRWVGDTNFMPTLGDVKVMPELLEDSYRKLAQALATTKGSE